MAEMNPGTCTVIALLSGTSTCFTLYHCFMFDRFKCMIPSRRHWHRCMLVYMLVLSSMGMFIWSSAWAYVKYQLGWVMLGQYGARPLPSAFFPARFKHYNVPLSTLLSITYSAQASLNAEEGLYWFHLMRSVRAPHLAKPWIGSTPFYIWLVMSIVLAGLQIGLPWAFYKPGAVQTQLIVQAITGGMIELSVVVAATFIVFKFPAFLRHVKAFGAGPDVLARLHFYHETNKIRTFFRYIFSLGVFVSGVDGLRSKPVIAMNPLALDIVSTALSAAFNIVLMVSVVVALPRTYGPSSGAKVMVGTNGGRHGPNTQAGGGCAGGAASQFALMSLLREGGQWEGEADILRDVHDSMAPTSPTAHAGATAAAGLGGDAERGELRTRAQNGERAVRFQAAERSTNDSKAALVKYGRVEEEWDADEHSTLPPALQNFTSHFAADEGSKAAQGPVKIRVRVEQEVHQD